ncbi:MAG: hypothetical protein CW338_06665, partial [Clostridiales bacterium]|nr:hypothetical protein [Clostridiales bacterium]
VIREEMQVHPSLILNKADPVLIKGGLTDLPEEIAQRLDMPLLGVLPFSMAVHRSGAMDLTAANCGDKKVETETDNIARRLLGDNVPLPKYKLSFAGRRRKKL